MTDERVPDRREREDEQASLQRYPFGRGWASVVTKGALGRWASEGTPRGPCQDGPAFWTRVADFFFS